MSGARTHGLRWCLDAFNMREQGTVGLLSKEAEFLAGFGVLLGREIRKRREAKGWSLFQLAMIAFDDETRIRRITALENGEVPKRPHPSTYRPLCDALDITDEEIQALKEQAAGKTLTPVPIVQPDFPLSDATRLEPWMETHTREVLEGLALRFGHDGPEHLPLMELKGFLISKANDLKALESSIARLPETNRTANIRAAAVDAVERGDLTEASELIVQAIAVQRERTLEALTENAELIEIQAGIALAENDAQRAYELYLGIAESFRPFDEMKYVQRLVEYADPLSQHGLRYGGDGLTLSVALSRLALDLNIEQKDPELWGVTQNSLGVALSNQAKRVGGAEGAELLSEAIGAYRAALRVRTKSEYPLGWAATQNNLAIALKNQAERVAGAEGAKLLTEAVAVYRAALRVRTEGEYPVDWAMTQNNLANALQTQADWIAGTEGAELWSEAIDAYRAVLRVRTERDHPVHWAKTKNNLANALQTQARRIAGAEGAALLAEAVTAYRAVFRVYTENEYPVQWAMTQNNLAVALQIQAGRVAGAEGAELLSGAVDAYRAALRIRTESAHPVDWAMTRGNLASALEALADRPETQGAELYLEEALEHISNALTVFTQEHMPLDHQKAEEIRQRITARLAESGDDA